MMLVIARITLMLQGLMTESFERFRLAEFPFDETCLNVSSVSGRLMMCFS